MCSKYKIVLSEDIRKLNQKLNFPSKIKSDLVNNIYSLNKMTVHFKNNKSLNSISILIKFSYLRILTLSIGHPLNALNATGGPQTVVACITKKNKNIFDSLKQVISSDRVNLLYKVDLYVILRWTNKTINVILHS